MADKQKPPTVTLHSHPVDSLGQEIKDQLFITRQETIVTIDALISDLEQEDGKEPDPEVITIGPGTDRVVDPSLLKTDLNSGLTDEEVLSARRKFGRNCLREERQNHVLKFFMLFVGPVQIVMEVSIRVATYPLFDQRLTHLLESCQRF